MKIKTTVRSGKLTANGSARKLVVKTKVRAGSGKTGDGLNRNARKL